MSDWSTIESEVVAVLAGLTVGSEPLLATVAARTVRDRKVAAAAIGRERTPAAWVMLTGREETSRDAGCVQLSVLLATRSLRDDGEARVDGLGVRGMWAVAQAAASALHDVVVSGWRLTLSGEKPAGGEEGTVLWEQRYLVARSISQSPPTFGGIALAGEGSRITVEAGTLNRASESFSFPGIDGAFERFLGVRERPIVWRGRLKAVDDETLNAIEGAIEGEIRAGRCATIVDAAGRSFESCIVKALKRRGSRMRDELTNEPVQDVEIEFAQLG